MADGKSNAALSFEAMINEDRKKKKAEALAAKMLGSGRRQSAPSAAGIRKGGFGTGLTGRIGSNKRSSSAARSKGDIGGQWIHDLHSSNPSQARRTPAAQRASTLRTARNSRLLAGVQKAVTANGNDSQANVRQLGSLSIRGTANPGPFVVIASNFAPGTTAADIEQAVAPVGGDVQSCRIVSASPTVLAEMVFADREGAENVIATFNNQRADGRMLYVYMKPGGPSPVYHKPSQPQSTIELMPQSSSQDAPPVSRDPPAPSREPSYREQPKDEDREMMDIDDDRRLTRANGLAPAYRRDRNGYQDGRYGFSDRYDRQPRDDRYSRGYNNNGLYSDRMYRGRSYR